MPVRIYGDRVWEVPGLEQFWDIVGNADKGKEGGRIVLSPA